MKNNVTINVIPHETWLKYFQGLWSQTTQPLKMTPSLNSMMESIIMDELMVVLRNLKSNKGPGEDLINLELSKYASQEFLTRVLIFLIWDGEEPP
jgi:hypothetical protein